MNTTTGLAYIKLPERHLDLDKAPLTYGEYVEKYGHVLHWLSDADFGIAWLSVPSGDTGWDDALELAGIDSRVDTANERVLLSKNDGDASLWLARHPILDPQKIFHIGADDLDFTEVYDLPSPDEIGN